MNKANWYKDADRERTPEDKRASREAMTEILEMSRPLGRVARQYLRSRGVWRPEVLSELTWNQSPYHGIVANIRKKPGGKIVGIQVTALTPEGQKVARRNFGDLTGGAIWLGAGDPPQHEKPGCVIGEGLETVLSAMIIFDKTQGLACMSWHNVTKAPILPHWQVIIIASDNDKYGHDAAEGLQKRLDKMKTARKVLTYVPGAGDWNDVLCQT